MANYFVAVLVGLDLSFAWSSAHTDPSSPSTPYTSQRQPRHTRALTFPRAPIHSPKPSRGHSLQRPSLFQLDLVAASIATVSVACPLQTSLASLLHVELLVSHSNELPKFTQALQHSSWRIADEGLSPCLPTLNRSGRPYPTPISQHFCLLQPCQCPVPTQNLSAYLDHRPEHPWLSFQNQLRLSFASFREHSSSESLLLFTLRLPKKTAQLRCANPISPWKEPAHFAVLNSALSSFL